MYILKHRDNVSVHSIWLLNWACVVLHSPTDKIIFEALIAGSNRGISVYLWLCNLEATHDNLLRRPCFCWRGAVRPCVSAAVTSVGFVRPPWRRFMRPLCDSLNRPSFMFDRPGSQWSTVSAIHPRSQKDLVLLKRASPSLLPAERYTPTAGLNTVLFRHGYFRFGADKARPRPKASVKWEFLQR